MSKYVKHKLKRLRLAKYYLESLKFMQLCLGFTCGAIFSLHSSVIVLLVVSFFGLLGRKWLFLLLGILLGAFVSFVSLSNLPTEAIQIEDNFEIVKVSAGEFQQRLVITNSSLTAQVLVPLFPKYEVAQRVFVKGLCEPIDLQDQFHIQLASIGAKCISGRVDVRLLESIAPPYIARNYLSTLVGNYLHADAAALISGLIWGDDSGLSDSVSDAFSKAGVSHITAVSGGNVGMWVGFIILLAGVISRRQTLLISFIAISAYLLLVGLTNFSAVRATAMWSLVLLAFATGRKPNLLQLLIVVIALLILLNPFVAYNIGFLLSAAATFAFVAGLADSNFTVKQQFLATIQTSGIAILATSPIIILGFGSFSLLGVIANVVAIPAALLLTLSSLVALLLTFIQFPLAVICWYAIDLAAKLFISIISLLTSFGFGYTEDPVFAWVGYLLLLAIFIALDYLGFRSKHAQ